MSADLLRRRRRLGVHPDRPFRQVRIGPPAPPPGEYDQLQIARLWPPLVTDSPAQRKRMKNYLRARPAPWGKDMRDSFDTKADALVEAHIEAGSESPVRLRERIAEALRETDRRRSGLSPFEAHVRQELERINEKLDRLLAPPQVRHPKDWMND